MQGSIDIGDNRITDLARVQFNDDFVTLTQRREITDNRVDFTNLLPQIMRGRLLIPDYNASDYSNQTNNILMREHSRYQLA